MPYAERLQVVFSRAPAGYTEDMAVMTFHFSTPSDGALGDTIRGSCETAFGTFWTSVKTLVMTHTSLTQYRWYDQQVWPTKSPLLRVTNVTPVPGTDAAVVPPQVACSLTMQTAHRKRWGRSYLPSASTTMLAAGRISTGSVDAIATAFQTFIQACKTAGALPVVWSPKGGVGPPAFAAGSYEPVTSIRVDDILDVVRRRRWQSAPYRNIKVIT